MTLKELVKSYWRIIFIVTILLIIVSALTYCGISGGADTSKYILKEEMQSTKDEIEKLKLNNESIAEDIKSIQFQIQNKSKELNKLKTKITETREVIKNEPPKTLLDLQASFYRLGYTAVLVNN